ncbi:MAG: ThiF family adenylyltransferase [Candidatus Kapaibacterium sp.]
MRCIAGISVTVCGAGALGANIAENLVRSGFRRLRVIDRDRIEERNLSTQPWRRSDIGAFKATILANDLYRAVGAKVEGIAKELTEENAVLFLHGSDILIDTFDNSGSRSILKEWSEKMRVPCLHVGLAGDYAEVIWNDAYRVPSAAQDDICDYPLARNLVMIAASIASETLVRFVESGKAENRTITFEDFSIQHL